MTDQQREIKRQPTTNIQGRATANSVSAQSLVMRNQITANAIDTVHVPNRKYGHFGHSVSSVVWIGITISVFSANVSLDRLRTRRGEQYVQRRCSQFLSGHFVVAFISPFGQDQCVSER